MLATKSWSAFPVRGAIMPCIIRSSADLNALDEGVASISARDIGAPCMAWFVGVAGCWAVAGRPDKVIAANIAARARMFIGGFVGE
jgi:hypothetical protein